MNSRKKILALAHKNVCWYDERNPHYEDNFDVYELDEIPEPRQDPCYCDNCLHGKDELAIAILNLLA